MDVLIILLPPPYVEGSTVWVNFTAVAANMPVLSFRVAYVWGTTLTQKRTAIIQAARDARDAYAASHGVTFPTVNQIEILGI